MRGNPLWFEVLRWALIVGGASYLVVYTYRWVRSSLRYARARKELVEEIERTEFRGTEPDAAASEAAASIPSRCAHTNGKSLCGLPVQKSIVERRNLVCDRYVIGECAAGHRSARAIIDD